MSDHAAHAAASTPAMQQSKPKRERRRTFPRLHPFPLRALVEILLSMPLLHGLFRFNCRNLSAVYASSMSDVNFEEVLAFAVAAKSSEQAGDSE
jgi:hypothetical protein